MLAICALNYTIGIDKNFPYDDKCKTVSFFFYILIKLVFYKFVHSNKYSNIAM